MKIEINGQSGDGKVLKVLIQRWLVVCCRVDQNTNPTLAGVCLVQPVTATHALLPGPAAPRRGYASPSAVIMTANRLVIHGPGLLNTLDTVPLLMGRIGYA